MKPKTIQVKELHVIRENGDTDILFLCEECEKSIGDYLQVVKRNKSNARCDRCGD